MIALTLSRNVHLRSEDDRDPRSESSTVAFYLTNMVFDTSGSSSSGFGGNSYWSMAAAFAFGAGTVVLGAGALLFHERSSQRKYASNNKPKQQIGASSSSDTESTGTYSHHNKSCQNLEEAYPAPRRFGAAIRLTNYRRYRELHDAVWEPVLERMHRSHIRNFCIFYHAETSTLYHTFEWVGHWQQGGGNGATIGTVLLSPEEEKVLFDKDMEAIANDPITLDWWKECEQCQQPFDQWSKGTGIPPSEGGKGDWWAPMQCVCHTGHWPTSYTNQRHDSDFVKLSS